MTSVARKQRGAGAGPVAVVAATVLASLAAPPRARACGVSTADGLSSCSLAEHEEETRPRWRLGASGSYTSTAIVFGAFRSPETRGSVIASLAYQPTRRWTLQVAGGSTVGGHLVTPGGQYDFAAGPTAAIGASFRAVPGTKPFVILTSNLSFSTAKTEPIGAAAAANGGYTAFDLRIGAMVGTTIAQLLSPYAVARVFGGPVYWTYQGQDVTGTDAHHYQLGAGLTVVAFGRVNVFAEGVPIGERSFAAGTAFAF
ncbi:MAG TPA: hypothetical protein VKQ32_29865 [Polyangia bacterium]|nr:hypothetical protein [Polyangia bacterium]